MMDKLKKSLDVAAAPDQLRKFLLHHLNRIFCAKSHLYERLPELADQANFRGLKRAIRQTCSDIAKQISRMEEIYLVLETEPAIEHCDDVIEFIENGFNPIHENSAEPVLRDLSVMFYMSLIESVEASSFQLLQLAAIQLAEKQIAHLLQKNMEEAKADRMLFMQLAAKYVN